MFVDDDQCLLESLRDALRGHRHEWEMSFLSGGAEALARLEDQPQDVVVCDLRMPAMDGATLLELVRDRCPDAVRIVLSGQADLDMAARAAAVAHRLVAKPCETGELAHVITTACAVQGLEGSSLTRGLLAASTLPSVPRMYGQLSERLASGSATVEEVARIVGGDIGMAAKILQLANSAYFGRRSPVSDIKMAVSYLGLESLRALVLHAEVFGVFALERPIPSFQLEVVERQSSLVASLASQLVKGTDAVGDAFTAGLLQDVGLLVLASQRPLALGEFITACLEQQRPLHEIELEAYGATHAELGAHVLALWGLPPAITEPVARHHQPRPITLPLDAGDAVHVAATLIGELDSRVRPGALPAAELIVDELNSPELARHAARWRELAADQFGLGTVELGSTQCS